jgi:hypothetical protein
MVGLLAADMLLVVTMVEKNVCYWEQNATNLVKDTLGDQVQICWLVCVGDSMAEAAKNSNNNLVSLRRGSVLSFESNLALA